MKRLMVMIGAVATALGLYADAPEPTSLLASSHEFEINQPGTTEAEELPATFDFTETEGDGELLWAVTGTPEAQVKAYGSDPKPAILPPDMDPKDSYLEVETDGAPIFRTFADATELTSSYGTNYVDAASVYVDMNVKLSPFEEAPTLANGSKIAVWVKATEADGDTPGETNLVVTCGRLSSTGTPTATNIVLNTSNIKTDLAGAWHRLTILSKIDSELGITYFFVYFDGCQMSAVNYDVFAGKPSELISEANLKYVNEKQLFPSLVVYDSDYSAVLSMAGFEGSGQIDNLVVGEGSPYNVDATITVPANSSIAKVAIVGGDEVEANDDGTYTLPAGCKINVTLKAAAGYLFANGTDTLVVENINAEETIEIEDEKAPTKAGFAIIIADTSVTTNYYLTLDSAVTAVEDKGTITVLDSMTITNRFDVNTTKAFTIDLNEKTITPTKDCKNGSAFNIIAGTVTIANGTIDGSAITTVECDPITVRSGATANLVDGLTILINTKDGACAYAFEGGKINISGGVYENLTDLDYTWVKDIKGMPLNQANVKAQLITVTGGKFRQYNPANGDDSGECTTFLATGYGSFAVDSYWVVAAYPKAVAAENAPAAADGELDVAYTFSATGACPSAPVATKNVDYYVTFDKAVAKDTITLKALMLNDQLQPVWVTFPMTEDIAAGVPYPLVAAMGKTVNVAEMYALGSFTCGVKNNSAANNGTKMTVQLAMNDPAYEIAKVDYTFGEKKTGFAVIIADTTTTTNYYDTLEAAITACPENGKVAFMSACDRTDDLTISKSVTLDVNGQVVTMKNISIAADKTVTLVNNTCGAPAFVGEGYVYIDGKVTVAAGAKLDMSKLPFGETYGGVKLCTGGIDLASTAEGIFYKWNVPAVDSANWMYGNYPQFFSGSVVVEGSKVTIGSTTWTGVAGNRFALEGEVATATLVGTHNPVQDPATFTYVESYTTFADALAACKAAGTVTLTANYTQSADFDLAGKTLVIGAGTKLTIDDDVVVTKNGGFVQNLGSIEVATGKTLDMSAFGWGAGILPAPGDTTQGTFAIKGTGAVKFAAGTDPNAMLAHNAGFFAGTDNGARFWDGTTEYKYTGTAWAEPVYVAQVGDKKYESLQAAVSAAADGQTVKLIDNVTLADRVEVSTAKAIMVDLNGKTIYPTATCGNHSAFNIGVNGATIAAVVTITNGTIDASAIAESAGETDVITVRAGATANLVDGLTIKINTKDGACAYAFADGTINITGGVYENLTDLDYTWVKDIKGMPLNQANVEAQLITVTGGKFKKYNPANGDDAGLCKTFLAEGYVSVQDANQYWVISEYVEPVAKIGDKEYSDLAEAIAAVTNGETLELLSDVDLDGVEWTPCKTFKGTFDGKGFAVKNLSISTDETTEKIGFIGTTLAGSVIKNLTITNVIVDAKNATYVGAVLGGVYGSAGLCTVSNVYVKGTIVVDGYKYVGGIMGHRCGDSIFDCHVDGVDKTVSRIRCCGDEDQVGGICGENGESTSVVKDCSVCNITIAGPQRTGGIVGRNHYVGRVINCSVDNIIVKCTVAGDEGKIGGIIGKVQTGGTQYMLNCTASNVTLLDSNDAAVTYVDAGDIGSQDFVSGTGVEGVDTMSFTAGTFQVYSATALSDLTAKCAKGYKPILDQTSGKYVITAVYGVTVATGIENGTVEVDKAEAVEGETVTVTATPADGYKLVAITTNGTVLVGTTFEMPAENVTVAATFEKAATPVTPGEEKKYDDEASAKAATNNFEVALAPAVDNVVKDKAAYKAMFKPVITKDGDKFVVTAELTPAASNTVQTAVNAAVQAIKISEVAAAASTSDIKVTSSIAGLYYQMNTASDLGGFTPVKEVLGNGGEITFSGVDKPSAAKGFYKISVTTAPVITD